ncbi:MAG: RNA-binding domain-containing protein [Bacteroidales bacterium]
MSVNIEKLIRGETIEWERLEFKAGWNPEAVAHTMCAFANDLHNWGGGYIIIGIEENRGQSKLPPKGLTTYELDNIQKKIIELVSKISPNYYPITQPYIIDKKHILVIWCPAGDSRPYTAPESLTQRAKRNEYIRLGSKSIVAKDENKRQLQELAARIPFDDRVNNLAELNDLNLGLIREYLQEIRSDLYDDSAKMDFADLCRAMLIVKGAKEDIRPINVGLLFFSEHPEKFFKRAQIELVWHKDDSGKSFDEIYFKGPIHKQLRSALSYIRTHIIVEKVQKTPEKAEAERFFNYPFEAVEETLANAVYHKSYEIASPIEIQVFPDKITILSYPGPVPPVDANTLATRKQIVAREYRNRRIGDFLKELHLTEGRGTGFPTIYRAMQGNSSPEPSFETDDIHYVLVTLPIREGDFTKDIVSDQAKDKTSDQAKSKISDQAKGKISDQAKGKISDQAKGKISDQARSKISDQAKSKTSDQAKGKTSDQAKSKTSDQAKSKTSDQAKSKISDQAKGKTSDQAKCKTSDQAKNKTSDQAKYKTSDQAKVKTSDQAKSKISDQAKSIIMTNLQDIVEFCKQTSVQTSVNASIKAKKIVRKEVNGKVRVTLKKLGNWISATELLKQLKLSAHFINKKKYLYSLVDLGWVEAKYPDKPTHPSQQYKRTEAGARLLDLLSGGDKTIKSK